MFRVHRGEGPRDIAFAICAPPSIATAKSFVAIHLVDLSGLASQEMMLPRSRKPSPCSLEAYKGRRFTCRRSVALLPRRFSPSCHLHRHGGGPPPPPHAAHEDLFGMRAASFPVQNESRSDSVCVPPRSSGPGNTMPFGPFQFPAASMGACGNRRWRSGAN